MPPQVQPHDHPAAQALASPRGALLARVFGLLERAGVPWCVLHGDRTGAELAESDVDLLVARDWLPQRLVRLLVAHRAELGAEVIQWFDDGAQFIALAGRRADGTAFVLQLHVTGDYTIAGRTFATGRELLASRRNCNGTWMPAAEVEFTCVLANRICKGTLAQRHERRLAALFAECPAACADRLARFFSGASSDAILTAAGTGRWEPIHQAMPRLREDLLRSAGAPRSGGRFAGFVRRVRRWTRPPCGLHVVFLGPDGVGKSTIIDAFERDLRPAFLHYTYLTFAPSILPGRMAVTKPNGPHSLPPRSWPASLLKATWWGACYTAGYYASVHPTLARGGLVVNHRYLLDAIVDRRRYRYSGPSWLLSFVWAISPKPDLVLLLDAPAEVIASRKSELPLERIAELRSKYRAVVSNLKCGKIIDASQPVDKVVADVEAIVIEHLRRRIERRIEDATETADSHASTIERTTTPAPGGVG